MRLGILIFILFSVMSNFSSAQEISAEPTATRIPTVQWNLDGTVDVDLISACSAPDFDAGSSTFVCNVKFEGVEITIRSTDLYGFGSGKGFRKKYSTTNMNRVSGPVKEIAAAYELPANPTVTSNLPIIAVFSGAPYSNSNTGTFYQPMAMIDGVLEECGIASKQETAQFDTPPRKQIKFTSCYNIVAGLRLSLVPAESVNVYRGMSTAYSVSLKHVLYTLNELSTYIRKSDRAHLVRLQQSIDSAIILTAGAENIPNLPLVHHQVTESLRLVVVMGTVLDELFSEYEDIKTIQAHIGFLRKYINSTREAYGWDQSLVGAPSQSIAALSAVLELEFRELLSMKSVTAATAETVLYGKLRMASLELKAIARGRVGGDIAAARKMTAFVDLWNSPAWQTELRTLLNAGPDLQNLVQPKLRLLLMAVESLADLTEEKLEIPDGVMK